MYQNVSIYDISKDAPAIPPPCISRLRIQNTCTYISKRTKMTKYYLNNNNWQLIWVIFDSIAALKIF